MINIENLWEGFLIDWKIYFSKHDYNPDYINLAYTKWEAVRFWSNKNFVINFPWEYDINDVFFKVVEWKDWLLNYFFRVDKTNVFLLQDPSILESKENERIDFWLYTDESALSILDRLELDWERLPLIVDSNRE